mmetsp:Transcript_13455/g.20174  ORF Transcript_13455/g.20174 Transcript_13455/m.20174 type:complete len:246 (+) Transcript_13455:35-772(+)
MAGSDAKLRGSKKRISNHELMHGKLVEINKFQAFMSTAIMIIAFLFFLVGFGLMGAGVYILGTSEDMDSETDLLGDLPLITISWVIVIVGAAIGLISLTGMYGGYKQNRPLLTIFFFFLFSSVLIQLCMGIFLFTYASEETLDDIVKDTWFEEGSGARNRRIDYQNYFECCGWNSIYDSLASGYNTPCTRSSPISCKEATLDWMDESYVPVAIFAITFACVEFIALSATVVLLGSSKHEEDPLLF